MYIKFFFQLIFDSVKAIHWGIYESIYTKLQIKQNQSTGSGSTSVVAWGGGCQGWVGDMICQGTREHFWVLRFSRYTWF